MGACLSKKGKKGKGGEAPDKQPYLPSQPEDTQQKDADTTAADVSNSKEPSANGASAKRQGGDSPLHSKVSQAAFTEVYYTH